MTDKPQDRASKISFFGREDYFSFYYAYAEALGRLLHAWRTPPP